MNSDLRISTNLPNHPKVKRLMRVVGDRGFYCLVSLWAFAAVNRPDGNLTGFDDLDIAIASNWDGEPGEFFDALCQMGFLDCADESVALHDWTEHNPYVAGAEDRSNRSRFNKMKHHYPELHKSLKEKGYKTISAEEYQAVVKQWLSSGQAVHKRSTKPNPNTNSNTNSNSNTNPSGKDIVEFPSETRLPPAPYKEVVSYLNSKAGTNFKHTTQKTKNLIKARTNEGFTPEDFKAVIAHKVDEWLGDERFGRFLRPETLFSNKFEGYLVAATSNNGGGKRKWNAKG